jgi:hypothetical protein
VIWVAALFLSWRFLAGFVMRGLGVDQDAREGCLLAFYASLNRSVSVGIGFAFRWSEA